IVKDYVEFLGGNITLASNPQWTTFSVQLPIQTVNVATEAHDNANQGRPCILVLEDDADFMQYLERTLGLDYTIVAAHTVSEAKSLLARQQIDLVLTDLSLPGESGLDLCRY